MDRAAGTGESALLGSTCSGEIEPPAHADLRKAAPPTTATVPLRWDAFKWFHELCPARDGTALQEQLPLPELPRVWRRAARLAPTAVPLLLLSTPLAQAVRASPALPVVCSTPAEDIFNAACYNFDEQAASARALGSEECWETDFTSLVPYTTWVSSFMTCDALPNPESEPIANVTFHFIFRGPLFFAGLILAAVGLALCTMMNAKPKRCLARRRAQRMAGQRAPRSTRVVNLVLVASCCWRGGMRARQKFGRSACRTP